MKKVWTITLAHCRPAVLEAGLERYYRTTQAMRSNGYDVTHVIVDHLYPIDHWSTRRRILELAGNYGCHVIAPFKNMGGHGGFNWAMQQLPIAPEDSIIGIDPDSNPLTAGWDVAALQALEQDPTLGAVSLMHSAIALRPWNYERQPATGIYLATLAGPEMFNVTVWKSAFLRDTGGLLALLPLYGHVEVAMQRAAASRGWRMAYLRDFQEGMNDVAHDPEYNAWKAAAVAGDNRNFDEYFKAIK